MKLTNLSLTKLVHGSIYSIRKDEYMLYYRCTKEQIDYLQKVDDFLFVRSLFHASVTIEFDTDASSLSFDYKIFNIGSYDSFDVYINGVAHQFISLKSEIQQDRIEIELPKGNKRVVIYLPCDGEVGIKNFVINGKYKKINNRKTLLCYGESITHGYGSLKSSLTYVNVVKRKLGLDIVNQGIGGYYFDENYIVPINGYKIDNILISLGTNQLWSNDKYERISKFFSKLNQVYPNASVLVVTPIWRGDVDGADELIADLKNHILKVCSEYSNITIIDGYNLVPHIEYYFLDKLHPNALGMELYGINLLEELKK